MKLIQLIHNAMPAPHGGCGETFALTKLTLVCSHWPQTVRKSQPWYMSSFMLSMFLLRNSRLWSSSHLSPVGCGVGSRWTLAYACTWTRQCCEIRCIPALDACFWKNGGGWMIGTTCWKKLNESRNLVFSSFHDTGSSAVWVLLSLSHSWSGCNLQFFIHVVIMVVPLAKRM